MNVQQLIENLSLAPLDSQVLIQSDEKSGDPIAIVIIDAGIVTLQASRSVTVFSPAPAA